MRKLGVLMAAAAFVVLACGDEHHAPKTTPGTVSGDFPKIPGGGSTGVGGNGSTSSSSTGGAGGAGGAGGGVPDALKGLLQCIDRQTHDIDCQVCRAMQMQGLCAAQWFACSDDPYCELSFFDCASACQKDDLLCLNDCYQAQPASQTVISQFAVCTCFECSDFCK